MPLRSALALPVIALTTLPCDGQFPCLASLTRRGTRYLSCFHHVPSAQHGAQHTEVLSTHLLNERTNE